MKKSVLVLFGGKSEEYEVSLRSAYSVLTSIDTDRYEIKKIGITREGSFLHFTGDNEEILNDSWQAHTSPVKIDFSTGSVDNLGKSDIVLPIVHGTFCEDGRLQGIFEALDIKYVGCDSHSSFLCMDKHLCKMVAGSVGVPVTKSLCVTKSDMDNFNEVLENVSKIGYGVFIKPALSGSSRGCTYVDRADSLYSAINEAFLYSKKVLIEEFIEGIECEIGALELSDGSVIFSEVGALSYDSEFYDYEAKYIKGGTKYEIPAKLPREITSKIKEYAKTLFNAFGCRGLSRLDFFVKADGAIYFNEINTLPGFTKISMFPMLFKNLGYSMREILNIMLNL